MTVLVAIETVVIVLLTVLVAGLLRSHADILRRLHALDGGGEEESRDVPIMLSSRATGRRAPDFAGTTLTGDAAYVAVEGARHRTLLAFLSSGCLTCAEFWDAFADVRSLDLPDDVRLVAVTKDADEESPSALKKLAPRDVTVVMSSQAWVDYDVPGSPYFVMIDGPSGRVEGEGTGGNWAQVHNLIVQASADGSDGAAREARIDRELLAHGIGPNDPLLYHDSAQ